MGSTGCRMVESRGGTALCCGDNERESATGRSAARQAGAGAREGDVYRQHLCFAAPIRAISRRCWRLTRWLALVPPTGTAVATATSTTVFTSTNESNAPMQALPAAEGWELSGKLDGLDDGDPELVYYLRR